MSVLRRGAEKLGPRGRVLLDCSRAGGGGQPWSYGASGPSLVLSARGRDFSICDGHGDEIRRQQGDPMQLLAEAVASFAEERSDGRGRPVAIGYLGYDLGSHVLPRLAPRECAGPLPDLWFGLYDGVWRWSPECEPEWVGDGPRPTPQALGKPPVVGPLAGDSDGDARYRTGVEDALNYIAAGDVYQINLSRRLQAPVIVPGDPIAFYVEAAAREEVPFGAALELGGGSVLSLSPEQFLGFDASSRRLVTRPIKGTRRRSPAAELDRELGRELQCSAKDLAEHLMIVDLERNDLGRVAELGSVSVERYAELIPLSRVHHLVSTVSCRVREGVGLADILEATFPGGSITGAPKIRAMQIIDELEDQSRGIYTGAIGYIDSDGGCEFSIAIRTATIADDLFELRVGGGVVADSTVAREFAETEEKAEGWRVALGQAED